MTKPEYTISRAVLVELLVIEMVQHRTITRVKKILGDAELDKLQVNCLDTVLSILGVPEESWSEDAGKDGNPYEYCRDCISEPWCELLEKGDTKGIPAYLDWVAVHVETLNSPVFKNTEDAFPA